MSPIIKRPPPRRLKDTMDCVCFFSGWLWLQCNNTVKEQQTISGERNKSLKLILMFSRDDNTRKLHEWLECSWRYFCGGTHWEWIWCNFENFLHGSGFKFTLCTYLPERTRYGGLSVFSFTFFFIDSSIASARVCVCTKTRDETGWSVYERIYLSANHMNFRKKSNFTLNTFSYLLFIWFSRIISRIYHPINWQTGQSCKTTFWLGLMQLDVFWHWI